jgi:hypothetical protein
LLVSLSVNNKIKKRMKKKKIEGRKKTPEFMKASIGTQKERRRWGEINQ